MYQPAALVGDTEFPYGTVTPAVTRTSKLHLGTTPTIHTVFDEEQGTWLICSQEEDLRSDAIPGHTLQQDEDVLDTWFSSALWPYSTLGWPDRTADLDYYYPGSVLITSRDIITNWVARMVLTGLYNMGEIPFDHVYIPREDT